MFEPVVVKTELELHQTVKEEAEPTDIDDADLVRDKMTDTFGPLRLAVVYRHHRVWMPSSVEVLDGNTAWTPYGRALQLNP